jgi:hypothetical protein
MTFTLRTTKEFSSDLNTLAKLQGKSDELIHNLACNAVFHSVKDGQVTPANNLISKMGRSSRRNDLISWMVTYGNFKYNSKEKVIEYCQKHKQSEEAAYLQAEAAFDSPFWDEVKEAKVLQSIDVLALIKSSVHKVKTEMKKAAESGRTLEVKHQNMMADLEALLASCGTTVS